MYVLSAITHKLQLDIDVAAQADVLASWIDVAAAADTPGSSCTQQSAAGVYDIVAAPGASTQRVVKNITIRNNGAAAQPLSVAWTDGTNSSLLIGGMLRAGQTLVYEDGEGWSVHDADGTPLMRSKSPDDTPSVSRQVSTHARASIGTLVAGSDVSFWKGTGFPLAGSTPAAAAVCSSADAGAFPLSARSGAQKRRLVELAVQAATASQMFYLEDRLAHMGGLNGTLTTAQAVSMDLGALAGTSNLAARKGASDYSEVEWYLEWYSATGATVATPTIAVTYNDGTSGNCNCWVLGSTALPASVAASRRYQILPAVAGKYIRGVSSVTLSASTATAGSFGVTAVRKLATVVSPAVAYREEVRQFSKSNAPVIEDSACLTFAGTVTATASGIFTGRLIQDVSEV